MSQLKDNKLWQDIAHISEKSYELLQEFPEEERWGMQAKLRQRAFDASDHLSEAIGSIDPRDSKWAFGKARAALFSLENTLTLAARAGYINSQPELLLKVQRSCDAIDVLIAESTEKIEQWYTDMSAPKDEKL